MCMFAGTSIYRNSFTAIFDVYTEKVDKCGLKLKGSFCEYRSTDYASLRKTKELKTGNKTTPNKDYSQVTKNIKLSGKCRKKTPFKIHLIMATVTITDGSACARRFT